MARHSLRKRSADEAGFSLVFVGVGLMGFLAVSMLAIDVGMLMTARNQAQNSADAGALAGATALAFNNYDDRTATGPAVTNALNAARGNQVMSVNVSVTPADVVFLNNPAGVNNRVQVSVYRESSRGNPVSTLIAQYFGVATANINAVATAEASPANAMTCVKPFTIPDRWIEKQTPPFDPDDGFDMFASKNKPLANPDIYIGPEDKANYTGYNAERDKGTIVRLKADNNTKIAPSFYYPYAIPGSNGASDYRWNIGNCNTTIMEFGQLFDPEPGNMVGPTNQGMDDLIARDPNARWDTDAKKVISTMHPSPRVVAIPLFDPAYYADGKLNGRNASLKFVNYMGFFVEEMNGNEVVGRITPIGGLRKADAAAPPDAAFPYSIRLVK
ncbi:MAG TPA: pilus assembly protein TadG-related protein [Vicinamibacterales bacterium]|nr:pilus assembly protein TadG-related protein [Vicinamibacterales bacterium]